MRLFMFASLLIAQLLGLLIQESHAIIRNDVKPPIEMAFEMLQQDGVRNLCHPTLNSYAPFFPQCSQNVTFYNQGYRLRGAVKPQHRLLSQDQESESDLAISSTSQRQPSSTDWTSILLAALCIFCAAFCAGLIMGILSLDEFMLHIKIRAGTDPVEQRQAEKLLPLVKQRHLVLVSLLLLNFLADECLPLFLDNLMPSWLAVVSSVFLVVFVSEIIPSAVFIGPDQLKLASRISPFAHMVIWVFYPIAYPIAKLLDWLLQGEDELGNVYNRGELSALVRLQYEGRLAAKRRELAQRRREQQNANIHHRDDASDVSDLPSVVISTTDETLHIAEVNMLEGALALKSTTARDVCTRLRKAYTIPHDMVLDKANVARIYGVGYSRIPIYQRNPRRPRDTSAIIGILMTRQLIMVDTSHSRTVASLPLYQPSCVPPDIHMIDLLQIFQAGSTGIKGGHMALVCEKPAIATAALERRQAIPHEAGVVGIITLEDVIEEMIQEPIYDEGDRQEREAMERAEWAFNKWKLFVKRRKRQREITAARQETCESEETPLLGDAPRQSSGGHVLSLPF